MKQDDYVKTYPTIIRIGSSSQGLGPKSTIVLDSQACGGTMVTPEGKTLNARCIGGVISNKTCSQDLQTVSLTKQDLKIFSIEIPLHQILGCKKGKALKQLKNATPSTVGGDKPQYMYKPITNKIVAKATSREMFRGLSSTLDLKKSKNKKGT